ncbi:MAG: sensor histidine kinase [Myxococcota bacterium]
MDSSVAHAGSDLMSLFGGLLEAAPDAMVVVETDGRIRFVNGQAERLFGFAREELLGQLVEVLVPPRYRGVHPGHRNDFAFDPKTRPMGANLDLSACRKDGTEFPAEISLAPLEAGGRVLVTAAIRDVTQRRKAEAKFRAVLEAAPDAMVIVDRAGKIALVNGQAERLFGYPRAELLGQPVELLVPARFREAHVPARTNFSISPKVRAMGSGRDLFGLRRDGSEFPVEISLSPLETEEGFFVASAIRDISERREAERLIVMSLAEKETLLKEVHHRVKNNLQVISSLLSLQSEGLPESQRSAFALSQARIQSIALVHEKLYRSSRLSHIDFSDYARTLVEQLFLAHDGNRRGINADVSGEGVELPIDTAVPCGLITNELVSNSLKHAFPAGTRGTVRVQLQRLNPERLELMIADDGIGFPEGFEARRSGSLGLELVFALARQLEAHVSVSGERGATFRFVFPMGAHGTS